MFEWLKRLLHIGKKTGGVVSNPTLYVIHKGDHPIVNPKIEIEVPYQYRPKRPKAVNQDIDKFMKHGRQSPMYRKSVKAKVQPEDEF